MDKLVENLEGFPACWDCRLKDYSNRDKKKQSFEKLAELCGFTYQECVTKYNTLRTTFKKDHNKLTGEGLSGSAAEPPPKKACIYYDELLFLIPTLRKRKSIGNIAAREDPDETEVDVHVGSPAPSSASVESVASTSAPVRTDRSLASTSTSIRSERSAASSSASIREPSTPSGRQAKKPTKRGQEEDLYEVMRNASKFIDSRQRRATSPEDDVSSYCKMLKYDLRKLSNTKKKKLMHTMSGLMLEALESDQPGNFPPPQMGSPSHNFNTSAPNYNTIPAANYNTIPAQNYNTIPAQNYINQQFASTSSYQELLPPAPYTGNNESSRFSVPSP